MFFDGNKPFLQELSRVNDTKKSTKIVVDFKSKGGQEFREYAKSASFGAGNWLTTERTSIYAVSADPSIYPFHSKILFNLNWF